MNRQTFVRFVLLGLLLALLVVPVLGAVAQPGAAGNVFAESLNHFSTLQVEGTGARPSAVIACTPPSSGNGCGGG